jgi:DNA recombination protein RmuC
MRKKAADAHLASVKSHIKELATKNYQDLIGKKRMDFVMMFIPNEAAYIAAMQIEPTLWQEAYDKRVLIVSPTQLISVLRMLRQLWKQDAVNKNVEEIARLSGSLLDKFSGMMDAFDDMERHISNTQKAYTTLRSRLSEGKGNIFVTAQKIRDLGAKSTKQLPEK